MLLPSALGFSPHPPVSVYGTGYVYAIVAFLGSHICRFTTNGSFPLAGPVLPSPARPFCLRPHSSDIHKCRNINLLSIDYAFRPRLRSRLPQGRSALPWNPWIFGLEDSHLHLATHSGILSSGHSAAPFGTVSAPSRMLPYRSALPSDNTNPQASVSCFSPGNFRRRTSRLVSYYALFECVAASEPTS